jgi:hypothetical protein
MVPWCVEGRGWGGRWVTARLTFCGWTPALEGPTVLPSLSLYGSWRVGMQMPVRVYICVCRVCVCVWKRG